MRKIPWKSLWRSRAPMKLQSPITLTYIKYQSLAKLWLRLNISGTCCASTHEDKTQSFSYVWVRETVWRGQAWDQLSDCFLFDSSNWLIDKILKTGNRSLNWSLKFLLHVVNCNCRTAAIIFVTKWTEGCFVLGWAECKLGATNKMSNLSYNQLTRSR